MLYLKKYIVAGLILLMCLFFLLSEIIGVRQIGLYSRVLIFPLLTLYYFTKKELKNLFFSSFLVFFAIAELLLFMVLAYGLDRKFGLNLQNVETSLYIIGYSSLLAFIVSKIKFKELLKKFPLHTIISGLFGLYLLYVLNNMVKHNGLASMPVVEYVIATVYNLSIIAVLLMSLLNYLHKVNKKALLLFIACLCMVFSDLVQTTYFFMAREVLLNFVYTTLLSLGFCFMYVYIAYVNKNNINSKFLDDGATTFEIGSTCKIN